MQIAFIMLCYHETPDTTEGSPHEKFLPKYDACLQFPLPPPPPPVQYKNNLNAQLAEKSGKK